MEKIKKVKKPEKILVLGSGAHSSSE